MTGPVRAPGTVPMIQFWLKLLKYLPQQSHHDAIIFVIIFGHVSLALILQLPGTAGAGRVAYQALISGRRACCDTAIGPSWAARRQCPDWTPVSLGPG